MGFETSYDSGQKPFSPDPNRGKWDKPKDFLFACFGLALKMDAFDYTYWVHNDMGILGILPYFVNMVLYMVPVIVIHSFMGQFSSSGFISAFRLSPFFKGMGYVSGFLSVSMLIYYSIYAAIPLFFILNSFQPTLPWSCEGSKSWLNETAWPSTCNERHSEFKNNTKYRRLYVPSALYFHNVFQQNEMVNIDHYYELSWHFVGLFALVWAMIALIFHAFSKTAKFGNFIRYMVIGTLVLLLVCFVRILFLPGALKAPRKYMTPKPDDWVLGTGSTFLIAMQAFGAGWGSVIALSSFNGFKTNIMSYSWIISFGQIFIYIMFGMLSLMLEIYFSELPESSDKTLVMSFWVLNVSCASALSTMGWPNMWTFIYYTMLLMAAVITITTQIFTVLQSLFDEFEGLRVRKQKVTFGLIGGLAICSIFFCTNHGLFSFLSITVDAIFTHSVLHLLLLLVVLWIYGRERFQRDIEFMLGLQFPSWRIYILRFIAPIILLICLLIGISWSKLVHDYVSVFLLMFIIVVWLPLLAIPVYGLYYLSQSTGSVWDRLRSSCRPTDWYPVDMEYRQKYEQAVGTTETHQLFGVTEEVN
ncbi:sodium-dependent acetylcholine transporter-like [Drosophila takahashii]|uniref:sodium-dependent acetylcholine transporter-like n=1 Tax=Drosophila takahashii TaxID=29030 RepID=UPI001CF8E470|nr:sodium-dependent acetylcholine transporter-like [Drosophila takahashii]